VELAGTCCALIVDDTAFALQRQVLRRMHSLLNLAAWLGSGPAIALLPGRPRIEGAHVAGAVDYAIGAWHRLPSLDARLLLVDELLDFFQSVLLGDGAAIVVAAWRLKAAADGDAGRTLPPTLPSVYRLQDFHGRPWEAAQYVLLPARGLRSAGMAEIGEAVQPDAPLLPASSQQRFLRVATEEAGTLHISTPQILHSTGEDGPKLAALTNQDVQELRARTPGMRVLPVVLYELARRPQLTVARSALPVRPVPELALTVQVARAGDPQTPVAGARVVAFTDFAARTGAEGLSDASGMVKLDLKPGTRLEALVVYPPAGCWGLYQRDITLQKGALLALQPIDLAVPDHLREVYGDRDLAAGEGVTVGVIDTGVDATHPDLRVAGGAAFVTAENDAGGAGPAAVDGDHGTHVAGIVAARGSKRGVAPGVKLMSYRVFPNAGSGATNYDIIRAIDRAVTDGCDLLNLSLGGAARDEAVQAAIRDALDNGVLCFAATGTDRRGAVSYPARWPEAVAVTAVGRLGTFPEASSETLDVVAPFSTIDSRLFAAGFANVGPEVDLAGPGVGIVSTVPGGAYAVMSGTSMACPAAVGAAAALLGQHPQVLALPRTAPRVAEMLRIVLAAAHTLGFAREFEGAGLVP
jgi:subtilisin